VNAAAFLNAVKSGRIGRALMDVWPGEPDVAAELLAAVDTGTPHIAGYSVDGKANGTSAAVRFTAVQLGITELQDFQVSELPPPVFAPEIVIPEGTDAYQAVRMAVLHTYDVSKDAAALRQAPGEFENLRGTYWKRREFHAYTVINAPSGARESLQKLGFNIGE
jgi:erythronate-4-phosphate dehydrogenase